MKSSSSLRKKIYIYHKHDAINNAYLCKKKKLAKIYDYINCYII